MMKKAFQTACNYGAIAEAWISEASGSVTLRRAWADYSETVVSKVGKPGGYHGRKFTALRHYNLKTLQSLPGSSTSVPYNSSTIKQICPSPTNSKIALLVQEQDGELRVEVWDDDGILSSAVVDKIHGKFVVDSWFGGLSWSSSEEYLSYVAEAKPLKPSTKGSNEDSQDGSSSGPSIDENPYAFEEDWGEVYTGVSTPRVMVFCVATERVSPIELPEKYQSLSIGQPSWNNELSIAFTCWNANPVRLGMIYCYQRPSEIGIVNIASICKHLSSVENMDEEPPMVDIAFLSKPEANTMAMRSPRFSPDGDLAFLAVPKCDTHGVVSQLCIAQKEGDAQFSQSKVLVPIPKGSKLGEFPGLYLDQLPRSCWRGNTIWMSSLWNANMVVLGVDTTSGELLFEKAHEKNSMGDLAHSEIVLGVASRGVLVHRSSPGHPGFIGWFNPEEYSDTLLVNNQGTVVNQGSIAVHARQATEYQGKIATTILRHSVKCDESIPGHKEFMSILLTPIDFDKQKWAQENKKPLVVQPHGGPHSAYTTSYIPQFDFLLKELSCPVLLVNYRGSTGLPAESLSWLPGNIGTTDVADVTQAAKEALEHLGCSSPENMLAVVGGSHGGFLTAHLSAQHPELVRCAVLRNPVTNIPAMSAVTDIPDWSVVEAAGEGSYNFEKFTPVGADMLIKMHSASPVQYVDDVRAPSLVHLGLKDRRVPPSQGLEWFKLLKSRGVKTELLAYPDDTHAIDAPLSNQSMYITTVEWIQQHGIKQ